ncbi:DUF4232 domain-containing protein [Solihabitans fulvus]|uniref:DUF4232 domain-containing protein n=1 Tax=Solihabitans fulvus TaxID=1892852 RepID=A0A5B2XJ38_9PSEU|nr:DUF4232 domain-containing protein [Solihabitans fulvus]
MQRLVNGGALVCGGVLAAALVAGCGSGTTPSGSGGTPLPVSSGSASPSGTTGSTGSAPAPAPNSPTASPAAPPAQTGSTGCRSTELGIGLGQGNGAAGTIFRPIQFTNKSDHPCVLQGFPGVSYVAGDDGHQVGAAAARDGGEGAAVTLPPGGIASAAVGFAQIGNFDPATCQPTPVRGIRVYPPGETAAMFVDLSGQQGCAGNTGQSVQLRVQTVQSGAGGA